MFPACCFRKRKYMAKGLVNGVLNKTCVCSLNDFLLVMGLYRGDLLFILECVYLSLLYPSLIFDMFCRMWMCVGVVLDFSNSYFSSVCECVSW